MLRLYLPQPANDNPDDIAPRHVDLFVINPDGQDVIDKEPQFREYVLFDQPETMIPSVMPMSDIDIVSAQKQCQEIGPIYKFILTGDFPEDADLKPSIIADAPQYYIKDNVLYHLYQTRV